MTTADARPVGYPPSPYPRQAAHDLTLLALHNAIRFSGLFARYTAQRWGLYHLSHAAERVAVELISRAVETTGNPDPNPRYTELGEVPSIGICVSSYGTGLQVEVWDSNATPPAYQDSHLSAVEEICDRWDCYQPRTGGKVIRAYLGIPIQRNREALPKRTADQFTYPTTSRPPVPVPDISTMQQVRDGLLRLDAHEAQRDDV